MCQKNTKYNWAGDIIIRDTVIPDKRCVIGYPITLIPTDIRQWITEERNEEMKTALNTIPYLPTLIDKLEGSFDKRALLIWNYVITNCTYVYDKEAQGLSDFWQFPEETLKIGNGDCEDSSYLLASLLLASGISPFCIRVCLGTVYQKGQELGGHAFPVYLDEAGKWRLLESTLDDPEPKLPLADPLTMAGLNFQYIPEFCLNQYHLWQVVPSEISLTEQLKKKKVDMRR